MKSKKITIQKNDNKNIFDELSNEWWNETGNFGALHSFNPIRIKFILNLLGKSIKSLNILDIGCGGGILCEPLARLGANVTGIDENKKAILVAREHAKKMKLKINYVQGNITDRIFQKKFDIITCMEVLEHVDSVDLLIKKSRESLNNGGFFVGSTINQTITSYLTAIFFAENILRIVPKTTHEWNKFIRPNKLKKLLLMNEFSNIQFQGVFYNFLKKKWNYVNTEKINYLFSSKLE
tara:strand:+ start:467 stop:1177 length:711 start_codon:yes stop_codon:yes gene_type:complete